MNKKNFIALVWISIGIALFQFIFFIDKKNVENFLLSILISSLYTFIIGIGNGIVNDLLNKKVPWIKATKKRVIISVISILIVNFVLVFLCNYVDVVMIQKEGSLQDFFSGKYNFRIWFMVNLSLMISAFLHAKGFMEELKKATKQEVVEQKLIAKSANAQFESLKNQLDPHFLFNSLNVLSSLIEENPIQAQKFTASMSKIYRYVLEQKDKELVTVEEEIAFAKTYCELLKTRFEDSVEFIFEVDEKLYKNYVVPLCLQLLLENCIKHNFATSSKPLLIRIFSENTKLCIENNLNMRPQMKESAGIGLANIVQRYSLLTKQNVFIEKSDDYFKVKLPMLLTQNKEINTNTDDKDEAYRKAKKRVLEIKNFYKNLISYCIIIPTLVVMNFIQSPNRLWFYWPMMGWGIAIVTQALKLFVINKNWEEKKIENIINKNN